MDENMNLPTENQEAILSEEESTARDYGGEVRALYDARPELRGQALPQEVIEACVEGESLTQAYAAYEDKARIQRQNAAAAPKAPVRSVTRGGGTEQSAEDVFLRGFNSD